MTFGAWLLFGIAVAAIVIWLLTAAPFGRASRYVALIAGAYATLWVGVGHAWGYTNPWVIGIVAAAAAADLAALPWFLRHYDIEDRSRDDDD